MATCYKTYYMNVIIYLFIFPKKKIIVINPMVGSRVIGLSWCDLCHLGLVGPKGSIGTIYNPSLFLFSPIGYLKILHQTLIMRHLLEGFLIVQIVSCALLKLMLDNIETNKVTHENMHKNQNILTCNCRNQSS